MKFSILATIFILLFATTQTQAAGFQRIAFPDPKDKMLEIGIWYPSNDFVSDQVNTPFLQSLAIDANVEGNAIPIIILSHGYGGWMGSHATTAKALADAGYIAVAPTHTGNNYEDESYPPQRWMIDRPRHIKLTLDYMLNKWSSQEKINPNRIGIFGYSAGGYTALVSSGAIPNISKLLTHCENNANELVCSLGVDEEFKSSQLESLPNKAWHYDERIGAAVVVAPGLGFSFDAKSLNDVTIPIQLWAAIIDQNAPVDTNSTIIKNALPRKPDYQLVQAAGHFSFMPPCNPKLEQINPRVWEMVCVDDLSFDREAFHKKFNQDIIAFFNESLLDN